MSAEIYVEVGIEEADVESLLDRVLSSFCSEFVSPRWAELHRPGREVHRFPWSLDYAVGHMEPLPAILPGEVLGNTGLTHLEESETTFPANRRDDVLKQMPILKSNLQAERRNAEILAEAVANVILANSQATIEWVIDREGQPDLSGFIPDELRQRLGEPRVPRAVCDTPAFLLLNKQTTG